MIPALRRVLGFVEEEKRILDNQGDATQFIAVTKRGGLLGRTRSLEALNQSRTYNSGAQVGINQILGEGAKSRSERYKIETKVAKLKV